jgi:octaprenyl-diphosphate synthase
VNGETQGQPGVAPALAEIQAPVRELLDRVHEEIWRIVSDDSPLGAVNHHLMGMRGKMFRPTLVLLSSLVEERHEPSAVRMAAAVELIHLATLVHDDAVDHSVLRRGMPTLNSLFSHQVSVIMGDFLYLRALHELVAGDDIQPLKVLTEASVQMTLGEMRQLAVPQALAFDEDDYEVLIRGKTAALFSAACEVGAICGAPAHREALAGFGERLGMAFQVVDDLIDYTETQETTGKPTGLDLKEHKVTLPLIAALREMPEAPRRRVEEFFDTPSPSDADVAQIVAIVDDHGGLDYARQQGERYAREAEDALAGLPDTPARAALCDAIAYVMDRRS